MSSRFVSSGRIDTQTGDIVPNSSNVAPPLPALASSPHIQTTAATAQPPTTTNTDSRKHERDAEWAAVQSQVDARRHTTHPPGGVSSGSMIGGGGGGVVGTPSSTSILGAGAGAGATSEAADTRSLYEVLQANKAAKQAAFEEANRIKNQFRPLDEDDVEFLDEVRARKRAEERRARQEEEEGLARFRKAQGRVDAGGEGAREARLREEKEDGGGDNGGEDKSDGSVSEETTTAAAAGDDEVSAAGTVTFLRRKNKAKRQKEADERREKQRHEMLFKGIKRKAPTTTTITTTAAAESSSTGVPPGKKKKKKEEEEGEGLDEGAGGGEKGQTLVGPSVSSKGPLASASAPSDAKSKPKLGLVDYGSDEEEDDD